MSEVLLSGILGFISATIVSIISHYLLLNKIKKEELEGLKRFFFEKQVDCYQRLWGILKPTSEYKYSESIIRNQESKQTVSLENAKRLNQNLTDFFFSEYGLFLSKAVRKNLFTSRDLLDKIIEEGKEEVSNKKIKNLKYWFRKNFEEIRNDIALRDTKYYIEKLKND